MVLLCPSQRAGRYHFGNRKLVTSWPHLSSLALLTGPKNLKMVSLLGKTRESALSTELEPFSWHFLEKPLLLECVFCFNHVVLKTY